MFRTAVTAILFSKAPEGYTVNEGNDEEEELAIISTIVSMRLRKINSLRAHLRRAILPICFVFTRPSAKVAAMEGEEEASDKGRSPVTRLSTQQSLLMGEGGGWKRGLP
jgi:hypothetical protein